MTSERCAECGDRSPLELDSTGRRVCHACHVPDIRNPGWKGNGAALEDVIVAPPNARRVGPLLD
jgi:hypothetical protein